MAKEKRIKEKTAKKHTQELNFQTSPANALVVLELILLNDRLKNKGLELTVPYDWLTKEGLDPTLSYDRFKNEGLEPTLSTDHLKMRVGINMSIHGFIF